MAPPSPRPAGADGGTAVQRLPTRDRHRTTGALASATAATLAGILERQQNPPVPRPDDPPPAYSPLPGPGGSPAGDPPPYTPGVPPPPYAVDDPAPRAEAAPPPAYTAVRPGGFDPRELTEFQLDELAHRIIGRVTRLLRTELRLDRERIGRLRDPRR
ncbi:extensin [Streptomyces sp. LP05-1]|uniref:Extensin n=1 Tax=Streptomyces pyxinae TaxID=2970734 RepID=A0ABT2CJC9_9ACTN|nr:extensin [Streptomyces sp. LP05-1]MCS0637526.1 extensin [Streptomyces sp. LP05-1]